MSEVKVLSKHYHEDSYRSLSGYQKQGGYKTLVKALKNKTPKEIIEEVKASGLRGRGGAGFPTGLKWSFLPENGQPRFLLCNADEGEPGTCKDRWMLQRAPHQLIEGMVISAYACGAEKSYIYIRGEYIAEYRILQEAISEAEKAGFLGSNILESGFSHRMDLYRGAGAYIAGEETGMISSLEGKKAYPKLKPPFPAVKGFLGKPSVVNNVETLAAVVPILEFGAEEYKKVRNAKISGYKDFFRLRAGKKTRQL